MTMILQTRLCVFVMMPAVFHITLRCGNVHATYTTHRLSKTDIILSHDNGSHTGFLNSYDKLHRCIALCALSLICGIVDWKQRACALTINGTYPYFDGSVTSYTGGKGYTLPYISIRNWGKELTGSCSQNNCTDEELCMPQNQSYTCERLRCNALSIPNAEVRNEHLSGSRQLTEATCKPGYSVSASTQTSGAVRCDEFTREWMCIERMPRSAVDPFYNRVIQHYGCHFEPWCRWTLMFRAAADSGASIKDAYLYGKNVTNTMACKDGWNPYCTGVYRNHLLERWRKLEIAKVSITVYPDKDLDSKTALIEFDGSGSTKTSWFEEGAVRILSKPWTIHTDLFTTRMICNDYPTQFLTIVKDNRTTDPCTSFAFSVFDSELPQCLSNKSGDNVPPYIVMFDDQNKPTFHKHLLIWVEIK